MLVSGVQGASWTYACIIDFAGYNILNLHITVTLICNIIESWYACIQKVNNLPIPQEYLEVEQRLELADSRFFPTTPKCLKSI